jgi:hypothetical protein
MNATDYDTPLLLATPDAADVFYRVQGVNADGQPGNWSAPQKATATVPPWLRGL